MLSARKKLQHEADTYKTNAALVRALILICLVRCTPNFPAASVGLAPGSPVETGDPVVSEPKPPEEPSFTEHDCIQSALPSPSDTTVTLTGDETIELTGIPLSGRKEIILNGHTISLTSFYSVSADAVLGIKPGEDCPRGTLDLAGMTFDLSFFSEKIPPETPLVEIRPVVAISEPQYPEDIGVRECPDILTVIQCN